MCPIEHKIIDNISNDDNLTIRIEKTYEFDPHIIIKTECAAGETRFVFYTDAANIRALANKFRVAAEQLESE